MRAPAAAAVVSAAATAIVVASPRRASADRPEQQLTAAMTRRAGGKKGRKEESGGGDVFNAVDGSGGSDSAAPIENLYGTKSYPVVEFVPSSEEIDSLGYLTPAFVLEVTWPRVVQFYHPHSPISASFRTHYVALARIVRGRSSRMPVEFHTVNCAAHRDICRVFGVDSVPYFLGFRSGKIDGVPMRMNLLGGENTIIEEKEVEYVADFLGVLLDKVKGGGGGYVGGGGGRGGGEESSASNYRDESSQDDVFRDAASSFIVTLSSSVYADAPAGSALSPSDAAALRDFLDLVRWAYPPETKLHELVEEMRAEFFRVSTSEAGLIEVLGQHVDWTGGGGAEGGGKGRVGPVEGAGGAMVVGWSHRCSGVEGGGGGGSAGAGIAMSRGEGGYACGLWSLLHVLSVGVAERHGAVVGDVDRVDVQWAGGAMRSFVGRFFRGCEACRRNWVELYDEACGPMHESERLLAGGRGGSGGAGGTGGEQGSDGGGHEWKDLALWIWEVHNEISGLRRSSSAIRTGTLGYSRKRTSAASTVWPSREDCPRCKGRNLAASTTSEEAFDRDAVYEHLKSVYWPAGVHNNRLIVLDRWTKAKRALSVKRLRDRMTGKAGGSFLAFVNLVWLVMAAYLTSRWLEGRGRTCGRALQRFKRSFRDGRRRRKRDGTPHHSGSRQDKRLDNYPYRNRHHRDEPHGPEDYDDASYVSNERASSSRPRLRWQDGTKKGTKTYDSNGEVPGGRRYDRTKKGTKTYDSNGEDPGDRRYRSGSGFRMSKPTRQASFVEHL